MLSAEQVAALRDLKRACDSLGADFALIGALAYSVFLPGLRRHTEDVDIAVALDLDAFVILQSALAEVGWKELSGREHRWSSRSGALIDLIPSGRGLRARKVLRWPKSGQIMSLLGFEHVFRQAVAREVADGLTVRVVPPSVLALLKIVAFIENPAGREKDLLDFAALLDAYEGESGRRLRGARYLQARLRFRGGGRISAWPRPGGPVRAGRGRSGECLSPEDGSCG